MSKPIDKRSLDIWSYMLSELCFDARRLVWKDARGRVKTFETRRDVQAERKLRVRILWRGDETQRGLAMRLHRCEGGQRCYLSICPVCLRRLRIWFIDNVLKLMEGVDVAFVTVIPWDTSVKAGQLDTQYVQTLFNRVRKQAERCGYDGLLIGSVDGTYEPDRGEFQVHLHFMAIGGNLRALEGLRRFYRTTATGSAGVVIKPAKDRAAGIGYCLKPFWVERFRYPGSARNVKPEKRRLADPQAREWLAWQARYSLASLLLLHNVRRRGNTLAPALGRVR